MPQENRGDTPVLFCERSLSETIPRKLMRRTVYNESLTLIITPEDPRRFMESAKSQGEILCTALKGRRLN